MSELELSIEAPSEHEVFADAFAAFVELVRDEPGTDGETREIELEGDDRAALLADWLDELVYLADAQRFVPERLDALELGGGRLRATVVGARGEPRALVKAATRHRLSFARDGACWRAHVVLDV